MPQMMPIWWSMMLILSVIFFLCVNSVVFFIPLFNLTPLSHSSLSLNTKLIDLSNYDL